MSEIGENYLKGLTGFSGFLKTLLISISLSPNFPLIIMGAMIGIWTGLGYAGLFIDFFKVHRKVTWHRVMFIDILVSLIFIMLAFRFPENYCNIGLMWGFISVFGNLLAPAVILDPKLLELNRIVGIITFILGLSLKFSGLLPEIHDFLSVSGGVLSVIGVGEHAK